MRLSRLIEEAGHHEDGTPREGPHPMSVVAVAPEASVEEVIDAIGYGGRGIVGVRAQEGDREGRIVGVVTDGDIRRAVAGMRSGTVGLCGRHHAPRPDPPARHGARRRRARNLRGEPHLRPVRARRRRAVCARVVHIQDLLRAGAI